jgi:hypothetical protein
MMVLVNMTGVPTQTGFEDEVIEILTGKFGMVVMVSGLLKTGFPRGHEIFDVRAQVTISPLPGV